MAQLIRSFAKHVRTAVTLGSISFTLLSCSAERVQPPVQGIENSEARFQLRSEIAEGLNDRVEKIAVAADQITLAANQLLNFFPNLKNSINTRTLKIFNQAISSLRDGLGADDNDRFRRVARFELDFLSKNDPCRTVDLILEGSIQKGQLGSDLQIRAQTCGTSGAYAPFIKLTAQAPRLHKFSIEMKPFESIVGAAIAQVEIPAECEVEISESYALDYLKCQGLQIHRTPEIAVILEKLEIDRRPKADAKDLLAGPTFLLVAAIKPENGHCSIATIWLNQQNQLQTKNEKTDCTARSGQ